MPRIGLSTSAAAPTTSVFAAVRERGSGLNALNLHGDVSALRKRRSRPRSVRFGRAGMRTPIPASLSHLSRKNFFKREAEFFFFNRYNVIDPFLGLASAHGNVWLWVLALAQLALGIPGCL